MKIETSLRYRNRLFYIVKKDDHFCAIEDNLLDEKGCLTRQLNGIQMMASTKLEECIKRTKAKIEVDFLTSQRIDPLEACQIAIVQFS